MSQWIGTGYLCGAFLNHSLNTLNLWAAADVHKLHYEWRMHLQCRQRRSRLRKHPINICPPCLPVSRARWEREKIERTTCVSLLSSLHKPLQDQMWVAAALAVNYCDESCLFTSCLIHIENVSVPNVKFLCLIEAGIIISLHSMPFWTDSITVFCAVWINKSDHHWVDDQIWVSQWRDVMPRPFCRGDVSHLVTDQSTPVLERAQHNRAACCDTLTILNICWKSHRPVYFATPQYGLDSQPGMSLLHLDNHVKLTGIARHSLLV